MKIGEQTGRIARAVVATVAVGGVTALLVLVKVSETTSGLVFLALVVWFATLVGQGLSLYVALGCGAAFDYFFLPPFHTFRLAGTQQWVAMVTFVASSALVSRVAELARHQKQKVEEQHAEVERLYVLSQRMMLFEDAERLLGALPGLLAEIFAFDAVALYVCGNDGFYTSAEELPMGMRASLRVAVAGPYTQMEEVGEFALMPLMLGLRPVGALAWKPSRLAREAATAVGAQVAIAVARSMAIGETMRLEAERETDRLRTALTDSLTHELRTPLTSIRAAATTLIESDGLDEESRHELASVIDEESARLDQLIGEAVEMAEIDANAVKVKLERHSVRSLLERAVAASENNLSGRPVVFDVENEETTAWFDAHLLGRVLRHLLENAAAYTPMGTRVRLVSRSVDERLEFVVEDNGPGIELKDLPHIFERFYRGKRRPGGRQGSGMGLAIARAILAAHGGGIVATSELGKGASFRFWVPLVEKEPETKPA